MVYNFFDNRSATRVSTSAANTSGGSIKNEIRWKKQLAEESHNLIITKIKKTKVYLFFKDNIWGADLADIQMINNYNKGVRFLLCPIDIFGKYALVAPLKDQKGITFTNAFPKALDELIMNHGNKVMILKFNKVIMKKNLFL